MYKILEDNFFADEITNKNCVGIVTDGASVMVAETKSITAYSSQFSKNKEKFLVNYCIDHGVALVSKYTSIAIPSDVE